jgi:4-hydroxy-3-methylbut-2-enyl diphosphate reductase
MTAKFAIIYFFAIIFFHKFTVALFYAVASSVGKTVRVILSEISRYCGGVRRAIDLALAACGRGTGRVYVDGELVHNAQTMVRLRSAGVEPLVDWHGPVGYGDCVLIRAHGCTVDRRRHLEKVFKNVIDGTCPHLVKISAMVDAASECGRPTVIIGDRKHPEVLALVSVAKKAPCYVVDSDEEIHALPSGLKNVLIVSQSTIAVENFEEMARKIADIYPDCEIRNTICGASLRRQRAIIGLKKNGAEAIVVVGGKHSNNTLTLVKTAENTGLPVFHVEGLADLPLDDLKNFSTIGVASGASTDAETVKEIALKLSGE